MGLCTEKQTEGGRMSKLIEAVKEASISVACLLDENSNANMLAFEDIEVEDVRLNYWFLLEKDIEHIQNQITIIENELEEKT